MVVSHLWNARVPVSIVMLLLGVGITVSSFGTFDKAEDIETFMTPSVTEGGNVSVIVQEFTDEDKDGSAGWYLMIQGEYSVDIDVVFVQTCQFFVIIEFTVDGP